MPQCRARPPHRPASLTSLLLRRTVQIELMAAILPTGLRSNHQGRPPKAPLRVYSGSSLLGVDEESCEATNIMTTTDSRRVSSAHGPLVAAPAVDSAPGPGPAEPSPEPAPAPEERSRATRVADGAWL